MELVAIIELNDTMESENKVIVLHNVISLIRTKDYIVIETKKDYRRFKITNIRELQITEEFFYRIREDN